MKWFSATRAIPPNGCRGGEAPQRHPLTVANFAAISNGLETGEIELSLVRARIE